MEKPDELDLLTRYTKDSLIKSIRHDKKMIRKWEDELEYHNMLYDLYCEVKTD